MCSSSPESQLYPKLHQKNCGQQVEGDDSAPLLQSHETPLGVLCPILESSVREKHGPLTADLGEGHKNYQGAG